MELRITPDVEAQVREIATWIVENAAEFPTLDVVWASAKAGFNTDGYQFVLVTLALNPAPPGTGGWDIKALGRISDRADRMARDIGIDHGAMVHPQRARAARAG